MATVVISNAIVQHVANKVSALYHDREMEAAKIPAEWYQEVYDILFTDDVKERMQALPGGYWQYPASIRFRPTVDLGGGIGSRLDITLPVTDKGNNPFPMHLNELLNGATGSVGYNGFEVQPNSNDERWSTLTTKVHDRYKAIQSIGTERGAAIKNAKELLAKFRTLAPALKAWPSLWELLPESAKQKHKEVTAKQTRGAVDTSKQLGELRDVTAAVAVKRIFGET